MWSPTSFWRRPRSTAAARTRAASSSSTSPSKQVAVARGLGFAAPTSAGTCRPATYDEILDRAAAIGEQWREAARDLHYDRPGEFYLYGRDRETGLSDGREREEYLESRRKRRTDLKVPARYRVSRVMHNTVFAQDAPLFPLGTKVYSRLDESPKGVQRAAHLVEQAAKVPMFGCQDCGDCSLPDIAYVCPEGPCAKNQRNGPCGGTRDGLCEVYDTRVHLGTGLRATEGLRRGAGSRHGPGRDQEQRAARNERVGQHVPGPRPQRGNAAHAEHSENQPHRDRRATE